MHSNQAFLRGCYAIICFACWLYIGLLFEQTGRPGLEPPETAIQMQTLSYRVEKCKWLSRHFRPAALCRCFFVLVALPKFRFIFVERIA